MKISNFIALAVLAVSHQSYAQDIRDQMDIKTGRATLVIPNAQPDQAAEKIKEAISQFAIPININFNSTSSTLPARPGSPVERKVVIQGTPATDYTCPGSYAEIVKSPAPVKNVFYYNREALRACLYAFQGGVKVEMIFHRMKKTESLTSGIFNGITKAIQGSDEDRISAQLKTNIDKIKEAFPSTLIASIQVPGLPAEEPDKDAAAQLIPPLAESEATLPAAQNTHAVAAASSASSQSAAQQQQSNGVDLSFVGARKELAAMGFKFYDQDQFVDAARRNDLLTVRLFLAAGGIHPSAPDSKGSTALDFSNGNMEMKMILTAFVEADKQGQYPGKISEMVFSK
ncbi:hypothetical protein PI93_017985 [Pandoraea fibrosis]|uniref:Uncharacterized protein n=1 Tax=Pandoraea fibrosis TaxID=1891094 RepID=A0ABX6HVL5_9BURK|nr:hypothetical protein [Pandoraea fibrosis]QHE92118.1 hypothetical protein PJ20_010015 [Pandoraea fibrosis]QHF14325.1 hypothetical protein PI93_017985 [Pandoraea fibrosis]